ncbi:uncharacterized protein LOC123878688 [Maniola jurtina]|uniref:uncharacterized protein LOC123878688 n=1 Tax=Maniola jurtina TaxID=191418 RepID=UPI001E68608D|nr:uncharacterized protein LOC123878688 [Maniola jurtina]
MDSNISSELTPKTEIDTENDTSKRVQWTSEKTIKLIETFENECRELWDPKHVLNKDRSARQAKLEYLAGVFGTNSEEISRKLHNLRTQFNNELRKIKRRASGGESSSGVSSGWEYFESLLFLLREPLVDTTEGIDAVNLELAEFQADEEIEFEKVARGRLLAATPSVPPKSHKPMMRVAASAPNPLPVSSNPMLWPDEPRIYSTNEPDECQIFGDFVASELRTLRSRTTRNRLKRMIQKAILQVTEEEDTHLQMLRDNRMGSMDFDPLN